MTLFPDLNLRRVFLIPAALILTLMFVIPICLVVAYSFHERGAYGGVADAWSAESYVRLADRLYFGILLRTLLESAIATVVCLVMAFPLSLYISRSTEHKTLLLSLLMVPFWTSLLIRTYAWIFLLRDTGLINTVLLSVHLIREPLPLLYNEGATMLGLVYGYLPFAVLPLYANLERLDRRMIEAAADLGAKPLRTLAAVVIPLCAPGFRAAAVLVFTACLGSYLIPDLLGGGKNVLIGNVIQNQFTTARDWPFGSALSLALIAVVMLFLIFGVRADKHGEL